MEKPGYKSTEYWLSLVAVLVGALLASGAITDESTLKVLGVATSLLTAMGYTVNRTWHKNTVAKGAAMIEASKAASADPS